MIIIEKSYDTESQIKGKVQHEVKRKAFADDDISGVQSFIDERDLFEDDLLNLSFNYIKL